MTYDIEKIVEKIDKLPEMFHIAVMVAKMLDDLNVNVTELSRVIQLDQGLTTQLLKLCNSAHYGFSRKIVSINDAVSKLGFKTIKSLVFVAISHSVLNQQLQGYDLEKGDLWRNSVTCAFYSRYLAQSVGYYDPEVAFMAGLLRDIGKLMIHEQVGVHYSEIIYTVNSLGVSFMQAEQQILGFNHSQIGAMLAHKWNFPQPLVDAIKHHHNPLEAMKEGVEDIKLISIIHITDIITMLLGSGVGGDGLLYNLEMKAFENLDIPAQSANIEKLISEMVDLNTEIEAMIGIVNG